MRAISSESANKTNKKSLRPFSVIIPTFYVALCIACQLSRTYPLSRRGAFLYSGCISALVFVHSFCVIPSNIPFVIQRNVLVCKQSNSRHVGLQTYIAAVGRCFLWRKRTPNTFARRHSTSESNRVNVMLFWLHVEV